MDIFEYKYRLYGHAFQRESEKKEHATAIYKGDACGQRSVFRQR